MLELLNSDDSAQPMPMLISGNCWCWLQRELNCTLNASILHCVTSKGRTFQASYSQPGVFGLQVLFSPGVGQVLATQAFWSAAVQFTLELNPRCTIHCIRVCTSQWSSPWYLSSCTHGLAQTKSAVCWSCGPSFLALLPSLEMMHCWLIRAVNHNHALYLLPGTRSKYDEWYSRLWTLRWIMIKSIIIGTGLGINKA